MTEWPRAPKGATRLRFIGPLAVFVHRETGKFLVNQGDITFSFDTIEQIKTYAQKVSIPPQPAVLANPYNVRLIDGSVQFDLSEDAVVFRDTQGVPWTIPSRNGTLQVFAPEVIAPLRPLFQEIRKAEEALNSLRFRWDQELIALVPLQIEGGS